MSKICMRAKSGGDYGVICKESREQMMKDIGGIKVKGDKPISDKFIPRDVVDIVKKRKEELKNEVDSCIK